MRRSRLLLLTLFVFLLLPHSASAQQCTSADIVLDTMLEVDTSAICQAAEPLADAGYIILIYLTDFEPVNEDSWFAHLDEVEIDTGFREASTGDFFLNGYALESSVLSSEEWAHSVTLGEALIGTALDTDSGTARVKQRLQGSSDVTEGVVEALAVSADLLDLNAPSPVTPSQAETAQSNDSNNTGTILATLVGVGALGAGGAYAYPRYVKPAQAKRRKREQQAAHLKTLQERIANLLLALEQLLNGSTPEETVLYQLFEAYGGNRYVEINGRVTKWLAESQAALNDVFAVRSRLLEENVQKERGTEQLISDWERLYVTLVGSKDSILNLNDKELRTLLDPLLVLERKPDNSKLAGQLDELTRSIEGVPLKVVLEAVDPSKMDEEGILGNVDAVQAEIGRLQAAQMEAPSALEASHQERLEASQEDATRPFVVAGASRYVGVDARLETASTLIEEGLYLRAVEEIEIAEDLLDVIAALRHVEEKLLENERHIEAIARAGFHAPLVDKDHDEIDEDLQAIEQALTTGDPDTADSWIDELANDSDRALVNAQAWRTLHKQNEERLEAIRELAVVAKQEQQEAFPAWRHLRGYPAENWNDLSGDWDRGNVLHDTATRRISEIADHNGVERQLFDRADEELAYLESELTAARVHSSAVVNRLKEVVSAEQNIDAAIAHTNEMIQQTIKLRDAEDEKIDEAVDDLIDEARSRLAVAEKERAARSFVKAMHAQSQSLETATEAYKSADAQRKHINKLQGDINRWAHERLPKLEREFQQILRRDRYLLPTALQRQIQEVQRNLSKASQLYHNAESKQDVALAAALASALSAFETTNVEVQQVQTAVEQAEAAYTNELKETKSAVARASQAIVAAFRAGQHQDAGRHWKGLAERAQRNLPNEPQSGMLINQLQQVRQLADQAHQTALEATRSAEASIEQARRRRLEASRRRTVIVPSGGGWGNSRGGWGGSSGGGSRPTRRSSSSRRSSSNRSMGSSSRRSSSRSSYGSSSRRSSSSRGSSRRR